MKKKLNLSKDKLIPMLLCVNKMMSNCVERVSKACKDLFPTQTFLLLMFLS